MRANQAVDEILERDEDEALSTETKALGLISRMVAGLSADASNLLGFILDMSYEEATVVTCDAWKRKCGGLAKNSFVVIRLNSKVAALAASLSPKPSLILARVTEGVATPVSQEVQQTIFEIHKIQAVVDPYTDAELQWGALKATILGTYYDGERPGEIVFGADIDSYVSPHFYEVFVPEPEDLELLINSFVSGRRAVKIGTLRYTETQTVPAQPSVAVRVAPSDFIANRTALFGKTRSGKSNTIKQIADMMLRSGENVGQVIFDIAAEYAYPNDQDKTSIYTLHPDRCIRYSLNSGARRFPEGEEPPRPLKVNFFQQVQLGHSIILSLWDTTHSRRPNYYRPLLEMWEPCDPEELKERFPGEQERSSKVRYLRAESMYFAALYKAGFDIPSNMFIELNVNRNIRRVLAQDKNLRRVARLEGQGDTDSGGTASFWTDLDATGDDVAANRGSVGGDGDEGWDDPGGDAEDAILSDRQRITVAAQAYQRLYEMATNTNLASLFPASKESGKPYFEDIHMGLLRILGDSNVSGTQYLIPFAQYHSLKGSLLTVDIVKFIDSGKTVIIDLANSDDDVARYYSTLICNAVLASQVQKFTRREFKDHSVLFYFEEAHTLFERDDTNLRSIYNRLAKEGAKYRIGLVYGTQSMTTLSPDLLKNTENFFIAHLNDDREVRELVRHYEFRDVGPDVQRTRTQGYVRMITLSHRYALPVQIEKFGPQNASRGTAG